VIAQSVQDWATGWTIGILGFDSWRGLGIFLFTTTSRMALRPTQPAIQWVRGALSLGVKRLGREADHSPPSSAKAEEWVELYLHSPNTPSWRGSQLKHTENFTFTFTLPQGLTVNQAYYVEISMRLREAMRRKRPDLWPNNWIIHHDNAPAHMALSVKQFLAQKSTIEWNTRPVLQIWLRTASRCFQKWSLP
jgi:hypothetical protein